MAYSYPCTPKVQALSSWKSISVKLDKLTAHHTPGIGPYSITLEYSTILKDKSDLILIVNSP